MLDQAGAADRVVPEAETNVVAAVAELASLEAEGRLPDLLVAAVGGGSNAIGLFHPFLDDAAVAMLDAGATRLGTSASATILGELRARLAGEEASGAEDAGSY